MFLALKEMLYNKLRFGMIIGIIVLVSYLLFLISGLSNGLMNMNREAINKWEVDAFVLAEEANQNIGQSIMDKDVLDDTFDDKASIKSLPVILTKDDLKQNAILFGINKDEFLNPNVTEGKTFKEDFEVVADDTLKEKGFKVGDVLDLAGTDEELTITGFTDESKYNAAPVLYGNEKTADVLSVNRLNDKASAFVIRDKDFKDKDIDNDLEIIPTQTFIENLPGYTEQKLTLDFMSYFLFAISAFIIAIFLYIITIQKMPIYGLLKAQGISNGFLARSLVIQTLILSVVAVAIAVLLTVITAYALPAAVPIAFDIKAIVIFAVTIILTAIVGGLFSIQSIRKSDPLKSIS